jgi:phage shock protein PspC (stress-responsive transcriptional regulator)
MTKKVIVMKKVAKKSNKSENSDGYANAPGEQAPWNETRLTNQHYHHYPYKKLYRSRSDKWLGGVAGGLAKYFNKDPILIRLLWVALTIVSVGAGVIAYILFWLFVDKEPMDYSLKKQYVTRDESGREHYHYHYEVS